MSDESCVSFCLAGKVCRASRTVQLQAEGREMNTLLTVLYGVWHPFYRGNGPATLWVLCMCNVVCCD